MSLIRDFRRYLFITPKHPRASRVLINERCVGGGVFGEFQQLLAMRYGVARSPEDAQSKFEKYGVATARELYLAIQAERPTRWQRIKRRALLLLRRIDGHDGRTYDELLGHR